MTINLPYAAKNDLSIRTMKCALDSLLAIKEQTVSAIADDLDEAEKVLEIIENGD